MPLYEYECEGCGVRFERRQHMEDEPVKECPECGGRVHRLIQPVGIIFKGSGFYVTDNRSKSPTATPGTVKESSDTSKSDSDASSSDTPSADTSSSD
jgi:putative FmdB family regulatory protein